MGLELRDNAYQQHAMFYQLSPDNLLGSRKITLFLPAILASFIVHEAKLITLEPSGWTVQQKIKC